MNNPMDTACLRFSKTIKMSKYKIVLRTDDERVIDAVMDGVDPQIARRHEEWGCKGEVPLEIRLYSGSVPDGLPSKPALPPTATFEEIEFFSLPEGTLIVFDTETAVMVKNEESVAYGFVSERHMGLPWILTHHIFYVPLLEMMRMIGAYYVHSGCVCSGDRCILICGGSGHGKSTLTYALARSLYSYMSDDAVFMQMDEGKLGIFSFPEKIKLDSKSCAYFEEFGDYTDFPGKVEIPLQETRIGDVAVCGKPWVLLFPDITAGGDIGLEDIPRSEAMLRLIRQSISLTNSDGIEAHLDLLKLLCESSRSCILRIGPDYNGVSELLESALSQSA